MDKKLDAKKIVSLVLRVAVAAAILIAVVLNYDRLTNLDIRAIVNSVPGTVAPIAIAIGIFGLKGMVCVIPAMLVYLSVGMAFDVGTALFISICGITLEVTVTYWLGRALGGEYVHKLLSKVKGGDKVLNMKDKGKFSTVFVARFCGIPIDFSSLLFGSMKLPFLPYMLVSVLGIAPRVIILTLLGDGVYKMLMNDLLPTALMIIVPVAAVVFVVRWLIIRKKKKQQAEK